MIGYVPRQEDGQSSGVGVTPAMDIAELFDCEIVVSMLPDDKAMAASCSEATTRKD